MSSYLNIYLKKKDTKEYLLLDSYSRNSEIYQRFDEENLAPYAGDEDKHGDLTVKDFDMVIKNIAEEKGKVDKQIKLYDKYLRQIVDFLDPDLPEAPKPKKALEGNETIEGCLTTLGYLKEECVDLDRVMNLVDFYRDIQQSCEDGYNHFECMAMNIY